MEIRVDFDLCQGHAVCMGEAPEVFQVDDNGYLTILQDHPPEEVHDKVELAAKYCPTGAITLVR
ncbi:MAG: ferredoxin [Myxococcota bacterium]